MRTRINQISGLNFVHSLSIEFPENQALIKVASSLALVEPQLVSYGLKQTKAQSLRVREAYNQFVRTSGLVLCQNIFSIQDV